MPAGTNCKLPGQSNIVLLIINWLQCSSFTDLQIKKHNNACENANKHRDPKQIWSVTKCNSGQSKIALLIKNWLRVDCWLQFWERNYVSRPPRKSGGQQDKLLWDPYTFGVYLLLNTLGVVNGAILANAAVALFPPVCKLLWCRRHFLALQPRPSPLSFAACIYCRP